MCSTSNGTSCSIATRCCGRHALLRRERKIVTKLATCTLYSTGSPLHIARIRSIVNPSSAGHLPFARCTGPRLIGHFPPSARNLRPAPTGSHNVISSTKYSSSSSAHHELLTVRYRGVRDIEKGVTEIENLKPGGNRNCTCRSDRVTLG
jgi:hypothetical protein